MNGMSNNCTAKIPENAKLQKETILSLVKGSTVFVNYLGALPPVSRQTRANQRVNSCNASRNLLYA